MKQTELIPQEFVALATDAWLGSSDRAAGAIASFHRQVTAWAQAGEIDNSALWYELRRLDDAGLSSFSVRILADLTLIMFLPPEVANGGNDE